MRVCACVQPAFKSSADCLPLVLPIVWPYGRTDGRTYTCTYVRTYVRTCGSLLFSNQKGTGRQDRRWRRTPPEERAPLGHPAPTPPPLLTAPPSALRRTGTCVRTRASWSCTHFFRFRATTTGGQRQRPPSPLPPVRGELPRSALSVQRPVAGGALVLRICGVPYWTFPPSAK